MLYFLYSTGGNDLILTYIYIYIYIYIYTMVKPYIKGADRCIFTHIHLKTQVSIYTRCIKKFEFEKGSRDRNKK